MPWNITDSPTTAGTSTVAKADSASAPPPELPMPWPILGKTKRKTKQSRKGWTKVRITNSMRGLFNTTRPRWINALCETLLAAPAGGVGVSETRRRPSDPGADEPGESGDLAASVVVDDISRA